MRNKRSVVGSLSGLILAAAVGGCGGGKQFVNVTLPRDGAGFERGADVPARVAFGSGAKGGAFRATLIPRSGGAPSDVTNSFNPPRASASGASAMIKDLRPGQYELAVELFGTKKAKGARDTATFTVRQPRLAFNPPAPITIYAGTAAAVTVDSSYLSGEATDVTLTSNDATIANTVAGVTIPSGAAASQKVRVSALTAGTAEVKASAPGYDDTIVRVNVRPVVAGATPSGARQGSEVVIEGGGFAPGSTVRVGEQDLPTTYVGATRLTAVLPPATPFGTTQLSVRARGQGSAAVPFEVVAAQPGATETFTLVRTGSDDLQVFRYTPGEGFTETDDKSGLGAGGAANVAVAYVGGMFLRADGAGVQRFDLRGNDVAPTGGQNGAGSRSTGVAAAGSTVLRATATGLERYSVSGQQVATVPNGTARGTNSASGAAVDAKGSLAVRAHATGIDVYRVPAIGAPILVGRAPAGANNNRGVGVCVAPGGAKAVRSHATGIDVYAIAPNGKPTRVGTSNDGGPSDTPSAVAVNASGTRAFRAHDSGIEVYDISGTGTPRRLGGQNASVSTTGVGAFVIGDYFFRSTHDRLEAYNIRDIASIPTPESTSVTTSSTGVGLAGR